MGVFVGVNSLYALEVSLIGEIEHEVAFRSVPLAESDLSTGLDTDKLGARYIPGGLIHDNEVVSGFGNGLTLASGVDVLDEAVSAVNCGAFHLYDIDSEDLISLIAVVVL